MKKVNLLSKTEMKKVKGGGLGLPCYLCCPSGSSNPHFPYCVTPESGPHGVDCPLGLQPIEWVCPEPE